MDELEDALEDGYALTDKGRMMARTVLFEWFNTNKTIEEIAADLDIPPLHARLLVAMWEDDD